MTVLLALVPPKGSFTNVDDARSSQNWVSSRPYFCTASQCQNLQGVWPWTCPVYQYADCRRLFKDLCTHSINYRTDSNILLTRKCGDWKIGKVNNYFPSSFLKSPLNIGSFVSRGSRKLTKYLHKPMGVKAQLLRDYLFFQYFLRSGIGFQNFMQG